MLTDLEHMLSPSHRDSAWTQASSATLASVQLATSLHWRAVPGRIYGSCVVSFAPKTPLKLTPFLGGFSAPRPMGGTEELSPTATWQSGPVSKSFSPVGTRPLDGCSNRNATGESQETRFPVFAVSLHWSALLWSLGPLPLTPLEPCGPCLGQLP